MISFLLLEIAVLNEKQLQFMTFMPIIWRIMVSRTTRDPGGKAALKNIPPRVSPKSGDTLNHTSRHTQAKPEVRLAAR
jgi:hypothetical protein